MEEALNSNAWLTVVNAGPSAAGRLISSFKMNIDMLEYRKMRKMLVHLDRIKSPGNIDVSEVNDSGVRSYLLQPKRAREDNVILNIHGGGFVIGSGSYCRLSGIRTALATGRMTLSVDYRLAPEYPLPAASDDTFHAYMGLLNRGIQPSKIIVYGVSAGGGICFSLGHRLKAEGIPMPAAIVAFSPATDFSGTGESRTKMVGKDPLFSKGLGGISELLAGSHDPSDPILSPVLGDFSGFPPIRIYVGERELLLSDSLMVGEKAYNEGVDVLVKVWKGMFHAFPLLDTVLPEARQAMREIINFINIILG